MTKYKPLYYFKGILRSLNFFFNHAKELKRIKNQKWTNEQKAYIEDRVNYYCRINEPFQIKEGITKVKDLRWPIKKSTYKIDSYEVLRYFGPQQGVKLEFGDVNYFVPEPTLVKSRPIRASLEGEHNSKNSVLLKLNKIRHFKFVDDKKSYNQKKDMVYYRGGIYQDHRIDFFNKYFNDPLCDLGHVGAKGLHPLWEKREESIEEHLKYKFIMALEGNDVASNLKWIMSSNSIAIMPKPKYETWFMEGKLVGGVHYIEIKDDYSDLHEKVEYYISNPNEAYEIIKKAHNHVKQFKDEPSERAITFLVLERYFKYLQVGNEVFK